MKGREGYEQSYERDEGGSLVHTSVLLPVKGRKV